MMVVQMHSLHQGHLEREFRWARELVLKSSERG
jgi:hypothetical protein